MNCKELAERLLDFVGGELSPEEDVLIRAHLEICCHCVHFTESYRLIVTLTRRLPPATMSAETAERLLAALRAAQPNI
jgi:anti-sigma factor RsiW